MAHNAFFSLKSFWSQSNLTDFVRAGFCYHQLCLQKLKFDCLADDNVLVVVVFAHCRQEFGRLHAYEDSSECRRPVHSGTVQPAIPQCRSDGALLHGEQAAYQRCRPHIAHQSRASRSLMQLVPRVVTTDCNRTIPDSEIPAGRGWIRGILGSTRLTAEGRVRTVWDGIGSSCMPTPMDHGHIFSPPPNPRQRRNSNFGRGGQLPWVQHKTALPEYSFTNKYKSEYDKMSMIKFAE